MFPAFLRKSKLWLLIPVFLIILPLLVYLTWLIEPSYQPQRLVLSNITDHQATVSWVTSIPTKGSIVLSTDSKFPLLPLFAKKIYKDDGEKNTKKVGHYTTHRVIVGDLSSQTKYQFRIYQGQKKVFQGEFTTASTLTSLNTPNPVYGRVLDADKKSPIIGAIVYLRVRNSASDSATLSTITNSQGGWSIDLANLRTRDLNSTFKLTRDSKEYIIAEAASKGSVLVETTPGKDKPWPDIILATNK